MDMYALTGGGGHHGGGNSFDFDALGMSTDGIMLGHTVTLHRNGDTRDPKQLHVAAHWSHLEFLNAASNRLQLVPPASRVFNADGVEIDDIACIDDGEILFLSQGSGFKDPRRRARRLLKKQQQAAKGDGSAGDGTGSGGGGSDEEVDRLLGAPTVGGYVMGPVLGEGGFGLVREARHGVTGEVVALKFLRKSRMGSASAVERVVTEIQCLSELQHPNVIRLVSVFNEPNMVVLALEYASGGDLRGHLTSQPEKRLSERDAHTLFKQVVSGVSYAHKHHITHRDLKLENLLLSDAEHRVVKITDFGLSRFCKPGELHRSSAGSLAYLPPEVLRGSSNAGPPIDVWALGVILYALLFGRLPFASTCPDSAPDRDHEHSIKQRILRCDYRFPESISVSGEARDLIRQMLHVNPDTRISLPGIYGHPWIATATTPHSFIFGHGSSGLPSSPVTSKRRSRYSSGASSARRRSDLDELVEVNVAGGVSTDSADSGGATASNNAIAKQAVAAAKNGDDSQAGGTGGGDGSGRRPSSARTNPNSSRRRRRDRPSYASDAGAAAGVDSSGADDSSPDVAAQRVRHGRRSRAGTGTGTDKDGSDSGRDSADIPSAGAAEASAGALGGTGGAGAGGGSTGAGAAAVRMPGRNFGRRSSAESRNSVPVESDGSGGGNARGAAAGDDASGPQQAQQRRTTQGRPRGTDAKVPFQRGGSTRGLSLRSAKREMPNRHQHKDSTSTRSLVTPRAGRADSRTGAAGTAPLHLSATGPATSGSPARQPGDPTVNGGPKRGLRFITGPGATPSTVGSAPLRRQEPRRAGRRASIGAAAPEQRRPQRTSAVGFSLYGGRGKGKGKAVSAKVRLSSGAPKAAGAAPGNESAASSRDAHASEASTTAQPGVASSGAPVSSPSRRRRAKSPSAATPMPPPQNLSGKPGQPPTAPGSGASSPIAPAMPPVDSGSTPRTHNAASAQAGTANAPLDSRARGGGSELGSVTMSPIQLQTAPETGRPVSPALDLGGATRSEVPDPLADLLEPPAPRQVSHGRRAVAARPVAAGTSPIHMGPRDTAPSGSAAPQSTNPVTKPPSQPLATVPTSVDNDGGEDGLGSSQSLPLRASARRLRRRSMLLDDEQADVVTACAPGAGHGARATPRRPRRFSNGGVLSADAEGDVSMDAVPVPMLRSNDSAV